MNQSLNTSTTYQAGNLKEALLDIREAMEEARRRNVPEPTSVSLATSDLDGQPSVRTVYLSEVNEEGLVFFINIDSGKGRQIQENPRVGLCLFWPELQKQVTVEGEIEVLPDAISDEQWLHRSRDSQLASWASNQKASAASEHHLTETRDKVKNEYDFEAVPRPANWKALLVHPSRLEFWETGWHKLRQRKLYSKIDQDHWRILVENP